MTDAVNALPKSPLSTSSRDRVYRTEAIVLSRFDLGETDRIFTLLTRDRGKVPLAFELLIYPMLDDRTVTTGDPHPYTGEFIWTHDANQFGWTSYLGQAPGSEGVSPYAAAARAQSLAGLPPTYLCVGALDLFLEEDLEYARRLMREGVPTELHVYPGAYHGFNLMPQAQVSQAFQRDFMAALRRALQPRVPA